MSSIYQQKIGGDIDSLGTWFTDPATQKVICTTELFGTVPAGKLLKLEYFLAVVKGFENADIGNSGEIGFQNGGSSKWVPLQFTRGADNFNDVARAGQVIQLLVPANAKIIVKLPLFFTGSGPGGGAELALSGVFVNY
jgi:hypothetical protein